MHMPRNTDFFFKQMKECSELERNMTHLVKCLFCKQEEVLDLHYSTQIKNSIPALGRWRCEYPYSSTGPPVLLNC